MDLYVDLTTAFSSEVKNYLGKITYSALKFLFSQFFFQFGTLADTVLSMLKPELMPELDT